MDLLEEDDAPMVARAAVPAVPRLAPPPAVVQQQPPPPVPALVPAQQPQRPAPPQQQHPAPPQQQQQRPTSNLDVLASLVRAQTKDKRLEDVQLLTHILDCNAAPGACPTQNCDDGKNKLEHFAACKDQKCFHCVLARLFEALDKGAPKTLSERLTKSRGELQDGVRKVKRAVDEYAQIRHTAPPEENRLATERLNLLKQSYNVAKVTYEEVCAEVYKVWVAPPGQKQYTADFVRKNRNPSPPLSSASSGATAAAPAAIVQAPRPAPAPIPQPKRTEEIDGYVVEYLLLPPTIATTTTSDSNLQSPFPQQHHQSMNVLRQLLEKESDLLTQCLVSKEEEWGLVGKRLKRPPVTEDKEPDWETHNLLGKQDIELQEQRLFHKRLCVSNREHEFISRSAEELFVDQIAELVQIAKHRAKTAPGLGSITAEDVKALMRSRESLLGQLAEEYEQC
ncbi:hypothetical protein BASA81_001054 [Batrachochytrium salamandrivorans]|nr:hypothetical protein BASA81_001054 [Batrachochytrium salamandrivorans]